MICKDCGKNYTRLLDKVIIRDGHPINRYINEFGEKLIGTACRGCTKKRSVLADRKRGYKSLDDLENCPTAVGRKSENTVCEYLQNIGFTTHQTTGSGPDIIAKLGEHISISIEVKKAYVSRGTLVVGPVYKNRKKDDLIAYEYNKMVHIVEMKEHLKRVNNSGRLTVTSIFGGV